MEKYNIFLEGQNAQEKIMEEDKLRAQAKEKLIIEVREKLSKMNEITIEKLKEKFIESLKSHSFLSQNYLSIKSGGAWGRQIEVAWFDFLILNI